MSFLGQQIIGFSRSSQNSKTFQARNPATGELIENKFHNASKDEIKNATTLAKSAFDEFQLISRFKRAEFLRKIADNIMALDDALIQIAIQESGLPEGRFVGERGRTVNQLRAFADHIENGSFLEAVIDTADSKREPIPKPDIRKMNIAVGPVVVFGASNFPLAFSVAGGDTASALAAGCPVIVKAHPSHPGTSELVGKAIMDAAQSLGLPNGVFSLLFDNSFEVGQALVQDEYIKSVAFTGSYNGGKAIYDLAAKRKEPIPVFAEMGSINPVILTKSYIETDANKVANQLAGSITLGMGQFCTNPGLIFVEESESKDTFIKSLSKSLSDFLPSAMLNGGISKVYTNSIKEIKENQTINILAESKENSDISSTGQSVLASTTLEHFIANPNLQNEIFGPYSLLITFDSHEKLIEALQKLEGQLTASFFCEDDEIHNYQKIYTLLMNKVGRLILNSAPTGVEVNNSMTHGGPFPASTDSRFTSVGMDAIKRFLRPVSFQDWPNASLPEDLQNANPNKLLRVVDKIWTSDAI